MISTNLSILIWWFLKHVYEFFWQRDESTKLDEFYQSKSYDNEKSSSDVLSFYKQSAESLIASTKRYASERKNYDRIITKRPSDNNSSRKSNDSTAKTNREGSEPSDCQVQSLNTSNNSNLHSLNANYQHINFIRHVISNRAQMDKKPMPKELSPEIEEICFLQDRNWDHDESKIKLALS